MWLAIVLASYDMYNSYQIATFNAGKSIISQSCRLHEVLIF